MKALEGQVVLVTGAGRGIGRSIALAASEAGAAVALLSRPGPGLSGVGDEIKAKGGRALALPGDVSDEAVVGHAMKRVQKELGKLDVLVNNAAMMAPAGPDWEADANAWWRTFEVNVRGTFLCARAVLPHMIAGGGGRIINLSSSAAYRTQPHTSAYAASKAAVTQFTRCLAASVEQYGIRVFAFAPGFVRTGMTERLVQSPASAPWVPEGLARALAEDRTTPMEDVVAAFLLLAAGGLDFLSGCHLDVRDGFEGLRHAAPAVTEDPDLFRLIRKELPVK